MMNNDNSSVDITHLCHLRWQPTAKDDSEEVLRSRSLDFFRDGMLPMYQQNKISVREADIEEEFFALAARRSILHSRSATSVSSEMTCYRLETIFNDCMLTYLWMRKTN